MAIKSKVTALSLQGGRLAIERDGKVRESKLYNLTPASLKRVYKVFDDLPWQNATLALISSDYIIAEDADVHKG